MANRVVRARVGGGTRRRSPTTWARQVSTIGVTVAPATKVLAATIILSNPGISETVRRTRAILSIASDQMIAPEHQLGAYGFVVVSDLAIAAGVASIPGPATDASDDGWFVWQGFNQEGADTAVGHASVQYVIDSKAMRRIQEGFGVAIVIENSHATHSLVFTQSIALLSSLS